MKSQTEYLTFNIPARMDFLNITPDVAEVVRASGVQEGLVTVHTPSSRVGAACPLK